MKACSSQSGQQSPSQALAAQPHLLRPLHTLIIACLETPTAALTANPVDVALYEALASALDPANGTTLAEEQQQRSADGYVQDRPIGVLSHARKNEHLQQQLLHFVLGTYVRRYLSR